MEYKSELDIDKMTIDEWLTYREDLLEDFYQKGFKLEPSVNCSNCDPINDYTCFDCECLQIEGAKNAN